MEPLAEDRQGVRRVVGRQVEEDDVVRGVAVGRDLVGRDGCDTTRATWGAVGTSPTALAAAASKAGVPASSVGLREDDDEGGRRHAELGPEERLGPSRFEIVEDEAARAAAGRAPGGASGRASRSRTTQAPMTHHARRTTNRPSRSKGVMTVVRLGHSSRWTATGIVLVDPVPGPRPVC